MELRDLTAKLRKLQNITPASEGAFKARIRHFMDNGVPDLPKIGTGARHRYNSDHLLELHLAMTLQNVGLTIGDAISVTKQCREYYINQPWFYLDNLKPGTTFRTHYIFIVMCFLRKEVVDACSL